jgi:hypothetical protein
MEHFIHYFIAGSLYQTVVLYVLIAALVYVNIALIKIGERKKVGSKGGEFGDA